MSEDGPDMWGLPLSVWRERAAIGGGSAASDPVPVPPAESPVTPSNANAVPGPNAIGGQSTKKQGGV